MSLRGGGTTTKQPQSTKASFEVWGFRAPLRSARTDDYKREFPRCHREERSNPHRKDH